MKGQAAVPGQTLDVSDGYGNELIRLGLAAEPGKAMDTLENKMLEGYENKMPFEPETIEQRSQGYIGAVSVGDSVKVARGAQTLKLRDPLHTGAGEDPEPHRNPDDAAFDSMHSGGTVVSDMSQSGLIDPNTGKLAAPTPNPAELVPQAETENKPAGKKRGQ